MKGLVAGSTRATWQKSGVLFAALALVAQLPSFVVLSPNRIGLGKGLALWSVLPSGLAGLGLGMLLGVFAAGVLSRSQPLRFGASVLGLAALVALLAIVAETLTAEAGPYARLAPGPGFWLMLLALLLLMADALAQMALRPAARLLVLVLMTGSLGAVLASGALSRISAMQEYAARASSFWTEAQRHGVLAVGSLLLAAAVGFPLGIRCFRQRRLRASLLPVLNFLQTVPSLAMFGLMIPVLSWVGANLPGARGAGVAGIGFAPAFLALFLYSLLPVVANTVAGLGRVPPAAVEAARGMGMTRGQRLRLVELPLALPVVIAAIRIVLVQNIGLAVIAGLIGGGGFGVFVFQGLNQTATDLILLGALPTVLMAAVAGILLDILVDYSTLRAKRPRP